MVSYSMISALSLFLASSSLSSSDAIELNPSNFDAMTAGKTVFLKMYAPWCGHCKAMAEDWSRLEDDFDGHAVALVASVDCTNPENQATCQSAGVQGYPTVVWGDFSAPESYEGGRDYASLKAFADEHVTKPVCSIYNQDPCTDEQKATIETVGKLSDDELLAIAKKVSETEKAAEKEFDAILENLQKTFEDESQKSEAKIKAVKDDNNFGIVSAIMKKRDINNPFNDMDDDDDDVIDDDDDDLTEGEL